MATEHRIALPSAAGPPPFTSLPLLVRAAIVGGRPAVLAAALALSAPGEYRLAVLAGWDWKFALIMPGALSLYATVAAAIAGSLPKGSSERKQANVGALIALTLAMTAQVFSHLIESGYADKSPGVVIAVSAVPPLVAAHTLHLTAAATRVTPKAVVPPLPVIAPEPAAQEILEPEVVEEPKEAAQAPKPEPDPVMITAPPEPPTQRELIDATVRRLYDDLGQQRPGTRHMVDALKKAGLPSSEGTARESRKRVEAAEPDLKNLPSALAA